MVLKTACFANNKYEDAAAAKCLSNLLAMGFRRITVDLYWNSLVNQWTLCPAALPYMGQSSGSSGSASSSTATAVSTSLKSSDFPTSGAGIAGNQAVAIRSDSSSTSSSQAGSSTASSSTSSSASFSTTTVSGSAATPSQVAGTPGLYQIGSYQCTSSVDVHLIRSVLEGHFTSTDTDIQATLKYIIINIHNAAIETTSGQTISSLPPSSQAISQIFNATLSPYMYTPNALESERRDLNSTWLSALDNEVPDLSYLRYSLDSNDRAFTVDGWPDEGYVELNQAKRMLVGFGVSDIDATQYNLSADASLIFAAGLLADQHAFSLANNGTLTSGCIFNLDVTSGLIPFPNNSFAVPAVDLAGPLSTSSANIDAFAIASCGISPVLNATMANATADQNFAPYMSFVASSLWSWYPGQPPDLSSSSTSTETDSKQYHCAAMNITAPSSGRWQVTSCNTKLLGACRRGDSAFEWTLSTQSGTYDTIGQGCPSNTTFSVPRTAAENAFLHVVAQSTLDPSALTNDATDANSQSQLVWIDLNDLDATGCWVSGANSRCPYTQSQPDSSHRIGRPTVAAVIVFCLALLTILVKCAANRRTTVQRRRRTRHKDGLGEYEGIPS